MTIAIYINSLFDATRNYLNAVQKAQIITYISITASFYHLLSLYVLIEIAGYGIIGASIATIITYTLNFIVVTCYCYFQQDLKESFFLPTRECLSNLSEYLKIAIPNSLIISLEYWSYEALAIYSSYISVLAVGAMAILLNFVTVLMMIPVGF